VFLCNSSHNMKKRRCSVTETNTTNESVLVVQQSTVCDNHISSVRLFLIRLILYKKDGTLPIARNPFPAKNETLRSYRIYTVFRLLSNIISSCSNRIKRDGTVYTSFLFPNVKSSNRPYLKLLLRERL